MKNRICKEFVHFKNFIYVLKMIKKRKLIGEILIIFHNKFQKIICMKKLFWGKKNM